MHGPITFRGCCSGAVACDGDGSSSAYLDGPSHIYSATRHLFVGDVNNKVRETTIACDANHQIVHEVVSIKPSGTGHLVSKLNDGRVRVTLQNVHFQASSIARLVSAIAIEKTD